MGRPAILLLVACAATGVGACRDKNRGVAVDTRAASPVAQKSAPLRQRKRLPRIDVHMHVSPDGIDRLMTLMKERGIDGVVNLSGMYPGPPRNMLETQLEAAARAGGRMIVFANVDFMRALRTRPKDYGKAMAEQLTEAKRLGAKGLKISKALGLGFPTPDGKKALPVDDPLLDPLFERAGALGMPVAIHTGDPKAFWQPVDRNNERFDELEAHPDWSFHGEPVPSWEELYAAFERRVARHPKTTFIGVHFGNAPEEPDRVARMLEKYPNLYIDTAARVPEIGRHDAARMRQFFTRFADRILFGTDTGVSEAQEDMMYGSNGSSPPTAADERRFFESTDRYFETTDKQFEHPSAIQGRWKIDGVGLPDEVLRKVYYQNAARLLGWTPPGGDGATADAGGGRPN